MIPKFKIKYKIRLGMVAEMRSRSMMTTLKLKGPMTRKYWKGKRKKMINLGLWILSSSSRCKHLLSKFRRERAQSITKGWKKRKDWENKTLRVIHCKTFTRCRRQRRSKKLFKTKRTTSSTSSVPKRKTMTQTTQKKTFQIHSLQASKKESLTKRSLSKSKRTTSSKLSKSQNVRHGPWITMVLTRNKTKAKVKSTLTMSTVTTTRDKVIQQRSRTLRKMRKSNYRRS